MSKYSYRSLFLLSLPPPTQVIFADEEGQDDGGIRKEFFMLLFSQILNPDFGMFVEDEESHLVWFRESVRLLILSAIL